MRRKNLTKPALAALVLSLSGSAGAASRSAVSGYEIAVPESRFQAISSIAESQKTRSWIDVGASSWAPSSLATPARVVGAVPLERAGAPAIFANYLFSISGSGEWLGKTGLNWLQMERSGTLASGGVTIARQQTVHLASVQAGVEFAPSRIASKTFAPYVGASILPSFAIAGRSSFDEGSVCFGVPVEAVIGSRVSLGQLWNRADLDLGVSATAGTIKGSSVSGIGIKGGVRVEL